MKKCELKPIPRDTVVVEDGHDTLPVDVALEQEVDAIWVEESRRRNGGLTNGSLLSFVGMPIPGKIIARFVQYKYYLAQLHRPALFSRLKITPLAVSGLTLVESHLLFAQRSQEVSAYPGFFELLPSGGITEACRLPSGTIDFRKQLLQELEEEAGITPSRVTATTAFTLIFDLKGRVYDIGIELLLAVSLKEALGQSRRNSEYTTVFAKRTDQLVSFVSEYKDTIVPTSLAILEARGFLRAEL